MSVSSCHERVALAVSCLATGEAGLHARLADAAFSIGILRPNEFPRDLQDQYRRIHAALTAHGSFDDSVRKMTMDQARRVADDIVDLADEVGRRYAIETKDY